jgi:hypothetical protein
MNIWHTASREEWLAARLDLLAKEKVASRQLAALAEQRHALPAVAIDKDYVFEGPGGKVAHPSNTTTKTRPPWCARDWNMWPPTMPTGKV